MKTKKSVKQISQAQLVEVVGGRRPFYPPPSPLS